MNDSKTETFFITDNIKLAASLATVGFPIRNAELIKTIVNGEKRDTVICEFDIYHLGVEAAYLKQAIEGGFRASEALSNRVDEIIQKRQLTDEEYIILAFDAARSALTNRSSILYCVLSRIPLQVRSIGNGRTLIYRDGASPEYLQRLVDNA